MKVIIEGSPEEIAEALERLRAAPQKTPTVPWTAPQGPVVVQPYIAPRPVVTPQRIEIGDPPGWWQVPYTWCGTGHLEHS